MLRGVSCDFLKISQRKEAAPRVRFKVGRASQGLHAARPDVTVGGRVGHYGRIRALPSSSSSNTPGSPCSSVPAVMYYSLTVWMF